MPGILNEAERLPRRLRLARHDQAASRELYEELVETSTTLSVGDCTLAAQRMAAGLNAAGIPTYGLTGIFAEATGGGTHGLNERIRVKSLYDARDFLFLLVRDYAEQK